MGLDSITRGPVKSNKLCNGSEPRERRSPIEEARHPQYYQDRMPAGFGVQSLVPHARLVALVARIAIELRRPRSDCTQPPR